MPPKQDYRVIALIRAWTAPSGKLNAVLVRATSHANAVEARIGMLGNGLRTREDFIVTSTSDGVSYQLRWNPPLKGVVSVVTKGEV